MESKATEQNAVSLGRVTPLLAASRGVRFAIGMINSVIVARALGVEHLGAYAYAMGIVALFGLLPNMGIATIVTRSVARNPDAGISVLRPAITAQALVSLATFVVIPGVASLLPGQPVPLLYVWLAAAQLTMGTLSWPYLGLLSGKLRYDRVALAELLSAVGGTICVVVAAVLIGTPAGFLGAHVVAAMLSTLAARNLARPFLRRGDANRISPWHLLRNGLPFGAAAAADSLYRRLDVVLLGQMSSTIALGLYNVAYKPTNLLIYFGSTMAGPLFPLMARDPVSEAPRTFRRAMRGLGVLAPVVALFFSGMAGALLGLLYGPAFAEASPVMVVLVWSAAINWLYAPLGAALQAKGCERWWLVVLLTGLALNGGGNLWAIPRWGAVGAAAATLGSELAILLLAAALTCRLFRSLPPWRPVVVGSLATVASGWILYRLFPGGGPVPATLAAIAIYTAALSVFGVFRRQDAVLVLRWFGDALTWLRRRDARPPSDPSEIRGAFEQGS